MKKCLSAVMIFLLLCLLSACSEKTIAGKGDGEPGGVDKGYYTAGQAVSGGEELTEINLKDISIARQGEDTVVTLRFRSGSDDSGVPETDPGRVPAYSLKMVDGIPRFVLTLEGVAYWDYALYESELGGTAVDGVFHHTAMAGNNGALYFNLNSPCDFRTEQTGSDLKLYFRALESGEIKEKWYIAANGFDLYMASEQQSLLRELGLYPTYCSDKTSIILLSAPFDSKEDAQSYLTQHEQTLSRLLPGRVSGIVALSGNTLPEYDEQSQIISLIDSPVGSRNGEDYDAQVLQANGRFLCWAPDQKSYVYARPVYETSQGDTVSYEELWLHGAAGDQPVMAGHEFLHILGAAYSADGRYLAVQEQNDQLYRSLEIVDMTTGESYLPTENGFGMDTPSYTWSHDKNVLYAISGEGEGLRFMEYDITAEGAPTASVIEEAVTFESPLAEKDGYLYFIRWTEDLEGGDLCSMPVAGGDIRVHTEATDFELSPDGRYASVSGNMAEGSFLRVYDLQSGAVLTAAENVMVIDSLWDARSDRLYYSIYDFENASEDQPLTLFAYHMDSEDSIEIMDMIAGTLYPAAEGRRAVLMYIFTQVNQSIPMSYQLDLP